MHGCDNFSPVNPRHPAKGATIYLLEFETHQFTDFMVFELNEFPGNKPKDVEYERQEISRDKVYVRISRDRLLDEAELQQWLIQFEKEHQMRPPVFVIAPK